MDLGREMAKHLLEKKYGLTSRELLDAIAKRFRLQAAIEGAVSEVHMERQIQRLIGDVVESYESHDLDGQPDFSLKLPHRERPIRAETKNVRGSSAKGGSDYRLKGKAIAYKVETQKTRTSKGDPSSRFYDIEKFEILGVCLGKKTGSWSDFLFVTTKDLTPHSSYGHKLAVFQRVPLPDADTLLPWYDDLGQLIRDHYPAPK